MAASYEVFLSHSSKDKAFVKELYRRLTRDGVRCFFDIESIGWGDNWVRALERAIDECKHIVFVLSPDFCNSEWVAVERDSSIADDPSGLKRKVRPLMLVPCRDLSNFPRFLKHIQAIDVSTNTAFEQNYPRICRELGGVPQPDFVVDDRSTLPPVHPLPEPSWMPYQSLGERFVGRVKEIWALHDSLSHDGTTVLQGTGVVAGTGGLGKTQMAIEYANRFGPVYTGGVYWVDAERGRTEMVTRISGKAGIEIDRKAEEGEQVAQLWHGMNARNLPYLVVLDNFPEENAKLRDYLPTTGRVHTIVTTRRQDLQQATVRLPVLSVEESVQLLNSGRRDLGEEARLLAERLGGLPLALELAKSYLNERSEISVSTLIAEMKREGDLSALKLFAEEYTDQLPSKHELDVVSTIQLSWNLASDLAKRILRVMGELAPVAVPIKLLRLILEIPEGSALRDELGKGIHELARLSLVERSGKGDPVAHRLILAFARHRNAIDDASPFDRCGEVLLEQMQTADLRSDAETMRELETFLPHAEFLVATGRLSEGVLGESLHQLGLHHKTMGRFIAARDAMREALRWAERSNAPEYPSIARSQSTLALVLRDLGELEEARDLLRAALASDQKTYEVGHPEIATKQSNLALVLRDMGELEEARDLLRRALASDERSFEPGHPYIAIDQSNLALVLRDLGELEEARDLLREALASNEKSFEPGHPSIAINQSNLALVLKRLGELEEARHLLRQALASDERSFAPGHPSVARGQSNLAMVLKDLGELEKARDLLRKSYSAFLERLGPDHPNTKIVKNNLESLPEE